MWRESELSQLDWREIKEIAESFGIAKPEEGGWTVAIPLILEKQLSNQDLLLQPESTQVEVTTEPPEPIVENKINLVDQEETLLKSRFSTDFYRAIGVGTCSYCKEKKRFFAGKQICPINKPDCPNK